MKRALWFTLTPALAFTLVLTFTQTADAGPPREWELGVSAHGQVGGSFLSEPDDKAVTQGSPFEYSYPGFAGVGGGGGVGLHLAWRGMLGVVTELSYTKDSGRGAIGGADITLTQWALHVPLMVRAAVPSEHFRLFAQVGPEFVLPQSPSAEYDEAIVVTDVNAAADSYINIAFGLGCEFMLPVEEVDLRIPFTLRGSINPSTPAAARDRIRDAELPQRMSLVSEWEYQAAVSIGLAWYFR